jgi:phage tail protein X
LALPTSYITRSGDTWDAIALRALGSELYMDQMLDANPAHNYVARFDDGVELVVPVLAPPPTSTNLPPWRIT